MKFVSMKVTVYKSTGSWYTVQDAYGKQYNARIKGRLKIDNITSTNPIAVGDTVAVEMENELEDTLIITDIDPRRNYITRQSPQNKTQHHIIAANIDQSLLFATLKNPRTSQGFIDRFLVTSEAYHIPSVIVFNKADLYKGREMEKYRELQDIYTAIGYKVLLISIQESTGIPELTKMLKGKITLLSGHSGVGKSSFINTVFPGLQLKTNDVSGWSGKGMHTTTFAEMFNLPEGGKIIDTPGIRELGLVDISRQELSHYYPEMKSLISHCQFNNCLHINEPGCAVKEAVASGKIHEERYISYYNILDTISEKNY